MMSENERVEQILRFLNNEMPVAERLAFEKRLSSEPELAKEVAFQKGLNGFLEDHDPALDATIKHLNKKYIRQEVSNKPSKKWKWAILCCTTLILTGSLFFLYHNTNHTNDASKENNPLFQKNKATDSPSLPSTESKPEKIDTNPQEQDSITSMKPKEPIATLPQSNYTPNPMLENIIQDRFRFTNIYDTLTILTPEENIITQNGSEISLNIEGTTNVTAPCVLTIYSNRASEIDNNYAIVHKIIKATPKDNSYYLRFNTLLSLKPGLYYLLIQREHKNEILYISSFKF